MQDLTTTPTQEERSPREYVLLSTCLAGIFSVAPFTVFRFLSQDWLIALFDLCLVLGMSAIFFHVFITRKTSVAVWILTVIFASGLITTLSIKGADQILWCYPVSVGIYYLLSAGKAAIVNSVTLILCFTAVHEDMVLQKEVLFCITMLAVNVFTYVFAHRNEIQRRHLHELSFIDPLTGVSNKRAFDTMLKNVHVQPAARDTPLSLILLDIDFFKKVNDTYGHVTGDDVLIKLASLLQFNLLAGNKLYRIGGEEYAVFPLRMTEHEASLFAEKLRQSVEGSQLLKDHPITISLGVAEIDRTAPPKEWIRRADEALYSAKRNGRNQSKSYSNFLDLQNLQAL